MTARPLLGGLMLGGLMLAVAAIFKYAEHAHAIAPDSATRATQAIIGLALAFYANFIPKNLPAPGRMQSAQRVAGWSFAVAGLGYAALWILAPLATADTVSVIVVAAAMAVTLGYALWICTTRPRNANAHRGQ
jgi:hypothetical protein